MIHFLRLLALIVSASFCLQASAVTIIVMNTNDSGTGSLRAALASAADGDTINFQAGLSGTITLTTGQLVVGTSVTINGPGANLLAISGNNVTRVFLVNPGKTVTIDGLTITNGNTGGADGGGIYNKHATLTINNSTISGNSARFAGGIENDGFQSSATLTVTNSTLSGNSAANIGGGIFNAMVGAPAARR